MFFFNTKVKQTGHETVSEVAKEVEGSELILVVDDLADMRSLIQQSLSQAGFKTVSADNLL